MRVKRRWVFLEDSGEIGLLIQTGGCKIVLLVHISSELF
jgi:hypothetical protein